MADFARGLIRRLGRRPTLAALVGAGAAAVLGLWLTSDAEILGRGENTSFERSFEVQAAPFVLSAHFTGEIVPGNQVEVVAPFDGAVTATHFSFGDQIAEGDLLITFDPADVARTRAEAEAAWLRAEEAMARMEGWDEGAEMRRVQRSLEAAESDLHDVERRLEETTALFERGLVSRNEYEGLVQQERARRRAFVQAQEEVTETQRRGQGAERRIAYLERELARTHMQAVSAGADVEIRAPADGVIVRPRDRDTDEGSDVISRVSRGQILGVIASPDGLGVIFRLDESDLSIVNPGQPVSVTGPGFEGIELRGRILGVSGQADRSGRETMATFAAIIRLAPLSPEASRHVRIGMSANIEVITYEREAAFAIPPESVQGDAAARWVMVRREAHAAAERRSIEIGRTGPTRVEVVSGLKPGDVIVW